MDRPLCSDRDSLPLCDLFLMGGAIVGWSQGDSLSRLPDAGSLISDCQTYLLTLLNFACIYKSRCHFSDSKYATTLSGIQRGSAIVKMVVQTAIVRPSFLKCPLLSCLTPGSRNETAMSAAQVESVLTSS